MRRLNGLLYAVCLQTIFCFDAEILQVSSRRGGHVTINCLTKVLEHSLEQSRTRSHPDVTFL